MTVLGEIELEAAAKSAAGNWQRFKCFCWFKANDLDDAEQWAVIYTHNRDSGLLDQSNAEAIHKALEPFSETDDPDVVFESHSHWAVGHIDGFSVRVFKNGDITEAFSTYHELAERLADYPILDEEDYSRREYEATLENITDSAWRMRHDFVLPDGWESLIYEWLSEHNCRAIENSNDQGGYPDESELEAAFIGLGFERAD